MPEEQIRRRVVNVPNPGKFEVIIGQANFSIKTVDDIFMSVIMSSPGVKCGVAMNEHQPKLTRVNFNDRQLGELAADLCKEIGAGHVFVVYVKGAFTMHVLPYVRNLPTVATVFASSSNIPMQVIVADTDIGSAVMGVVDGMSVTRVEDEKEKQERREQVEKFGYKLP
ncbi:adenosine monophosphate-protein transferase [Candidatus Micrarchaeota archaeon]|nr:adenosine monophosphate-protein transferase [Candidatus Micrarchaeota archaeon]